MSHLAKQRKLPLGDLNLPQAIPYTKPTKAAKIKISDTIDCIIGALKLAITPSGARRIESAGYSAAASPVNINSNTAVAILKALFSEGVIELLFSLPKSRSSSSGQAFQSLPGQGIGDQVASII